MKIFFDVGHKAKKEMYEMIENTITESGHQLLNEIQARRETPLWNDASISNIKKREIYTDVIKNIRASDICIFDISESSMRIGHEYTLATNNSKPTLLSMSSQVHDVQNLFINGSSSGYMTIKNYRNDDELKKIVSRFINKYKNGSRVRLNLTIDKCHNDYLEWRQTIDNLNKTDAVKESLDTMMVGDERYSKYLELSEDK